MKKRESKNISRRQFVGGAVAGALATAAQGTARSQAGRPNVVFILADDLGYGDLSCYGQPSYSTPALDQMARSGMRLTNAYSASPVCTPTRCAFVTGRYPARTPVGLEEPLSWKKQVGGRVGLAPEHPTIASLLKASGYDTALVGKWHLGYLPEFGPKRHGFDEFFGILSGGADYYTHKDPNGEIDLYEDTVPVERAGYMTDLLTDRAVQFIARKRNRPFYLSLHYTAPHWPWQSPTDEQAAKAYDGSSGGYARFTEGGSLKIYAGMMKSLDDGIASVLKTIKARNLTQNTLVIFTSDNGGERFSHNWPFSGQKFQLREGGIRVPAIIHWPGVVPQGRSTDQTAITMDWTATILGVGGAKADPKYSLDGQDLLAVIKGERAAFERTLFWRHGTQRAMRRGKWKYFHDGQNDFLFDLSFDEREQVSFKEKNPDLFRQLQSEYQKWDAELLPAHQR